MVTAAFTILFGLEALFIRFLAIARAGGPPRASGILTFVRRTIYYRALHKSAPTKDASTVKGIAK
jgi:hypothetical protein